MREVGSPAKYALNKVITRTLNSLCEKPLSVLDVGCGDGNYAKILKSLGCSYCGIDVLTHKNWTTECKVYDAEYLKDFYGKYDLTMSIHSLEHIEDDITTVQGMAARLSESGIILLALPGKYSRLLYPSHGYRTYSIKDIFALANESNLLVENIVSTGGIASSVLHYISWTKPSKRGIGVSKFFKRHNILVEIFYKLEQWADYIDGLLEIWPSNYVVTLRRSPC